MKIRKRSGYSRRQLRKVRTREKIKGTADRPRLCVFRSNSRIYAQIIDDSSGQTLVSAGSGSKEQGRETKRKEAYRVGEILAAKAIKLNVKRVVFDRNGYLYHGRVEELARGAREGGLEF
ncbi:MAG: 50S ribosomal protein L18 [Patescibacteria group bacterium]|nr:50S ribosomal protein L18 [Patescibacteria group bacterium]